MTEHIMFLDIETVEGKTALIGLAVDDGPVTLNTNYEKDVTRYMADPEYTKVSHSTYDWRQFILADQPVDGPLHDTMVMAWRLDENQPLDLAALTARYLPDTASKRRRIKQKNKELWFTYKETDYAFSEYDIWPQSVATAFRSYNVNDVTLLRKLYYELRRLLKVEGLEDYWLREDVPFTTTLLKMEARGMPIDLDAAADLATRLERDLGVAKSNLMAEADLPPSFNLNSHDQVAKLLYLPGFTIKARVPVTDGIIAGLDPTGAASGKPYHLVVEKIGRKWAYGTWMCQGFGLTPPPRRTDPKTGEPGPEFPTDTATLLYHYGSHPWVREYCLSFKKLDRVLSGYLRKYPLIARDGRLYGQFHQTGTVTGRLSSSDPNLQNQPARGELGKAVRSLFKGNLVVGDYDGLEMRIMAHYSQDPKLLTIFRDGKDPHATTAQAIFGPGFTSEERDVGKTVNYALGYGAGPGKLALVLSLAGHHTTFGEARDYMDEVQGFYDRLFEWREEVIEDAAVRGYVTTLMGRRRHLVGNKDNVAAWKTGTYGSRQAVNSLIQGGAADIIQRVMPKVDWPDLRLVCQVHDELIWEWDDKHRPTRETLNSIQVLGEQGHGFRLTVPLSFVPKVCKSWAGKSGEVEVDLAEAA